MNTLNKPDKYFGSQKAKIDGQTVIEFEPHREFLLDTLGFTYCNPDCNVISLIADGKEWLTLTTSCQEMQQQTSLWAPARIPVRKKWSITLIGKCDEMTIKWSGRPMP